MAKKIEVGVIAPDFSLSDHNGVVHQLSDYRGDWVVLYFYPKDNTAVCTKQACAFRDQFEDFKDAGAVVIGISSDDQKSHRQFVEEYRLPFILLSDTNQLVRQKYGAKQLFGIIPSRVTFVISPEGIVKMVFNALFRDQEHVTKSLAIIKGVGNK